MGGQHGGAGGDRFQLANLRRGPARERTRDSIGTAAVPAHAARVGRAGSLRAIFQFGAALLLAVPVNIFIAGFVGTQRVWFVRIFEGRTLTGREVAALTRAFIGRFVILGFVCTLPSWCVFGIVGAAVFHTWGPGGLLTVSIGYAVVLDIALTFVVPALSLSTGSVREAFGLGLRMVRDERPASMWYALAPGLTLNAFSLLLPRSLFAPGARIAIVLAAAALSLWFKGAIVAFYVRHQPPAHRRR